MEKLPSFLHGKPITDQGKTGQRGGRTSVTIQLAWLWLRHQPHSALARWFHELVGDNGRRLRKTTIVAFARMLLVALWKYASPGVVVEGAILGNVEGDAI